MSRWVYLVFRGKKPVFLRFSWVFTYPMPVEQVEPLSPRARILCKAYPPVDIGVDLGHDKLSRYRSRSTVTLETNSENRVAFTAYSARTASPAWIGCREVYSTSEE